MDTAWPCTCCLKATAREHGWAGPGRSLPAHSATANPVTAATVVPAHQKVGSPWGHSRVRSRAHRPECWRQSGTPPLPCQGRQQEATAASSQPDPARSLQSHRWLLPDSPSSFHIPHGSREGTLAWRRPWPWVTGSWPGLHAPGADDVIASHTAGLAQLEGMQPPWGTDVFLGTGNTAGGPSGQPSATGSRHQGAGRQRTVRSANRPAGQGWLW